MLEINGTELDFDLFDADTAEVYEIAYSEAQDIIAELQKSDKMSIAFRRGCAAVKKVFDTIFGEGVGDEVCGEKDNFRICMEAFQELTDEVIRQKKELGTMSSAAISKYQGNRAERRAKK